MALFKSSLPGHSAIYLKVPLFGVFVCLFVFAFMKQNNFKDKFQCKTAEQEFITACISPMA